MKITSLKIYVIFILAVSCFMSANLSAMPIIRNAELSNAVTQAEILFAEKAYLDAAQAYLTAINLTNADAQAELNERKGYSLCPYALVLYAQRLHSLKEAKHCRQKSFGNECIQILDKFKTQASAKKWNEYMVVYDYLMKHYKINNNKSMTINTFEEALDYKPIHHNTCYYIDYLMTYAPNPIDNNTIYKIETALQKCKQNTTKLPSNIALRGLALTRRKGKDSNTFDAALKFIKSYPNAIPGELEAAIITARDAIPFNDPEKINEYYNILTVLAARQTNNDAQLKFIGFIINERKKIEAIMPEIKTK